MLKLGLAVPDPQIGCKVLCTFDEALEIVKKIDRITPGYTKVLYLVGWQYNGHDDRYPEFFEVNPQLKSPQDATALDSLLRLVEESKSTIRSSVIISIFPMPIRKARSGRNTWQTA